MIYTAIDKWNSPPDSYLEHYGVKGMKWGHRKQIRYQEKYAKRLSNYMLDRNERNYKKLQKIDSKYRKANGQNSISMNAVNRNGQKYVNLGFEGSDTKYTVSGDMIARSSPQKTEKGLSKGQKIAIGVGIGAAVAVGVGVGAYMLKKNGLKPAPLSSAQLKSMGISTFKPETIKIDRIPVSKINVAKTSNAGFTKNIIKGKSTSRTLGVGAKNRVESALNVENKNLHNAIASKNKNNIVNANRKYSAAIENYGKASIHGPVYSYNGMYRPRLTTNSGRKIVKRLKRQ